MSTPAAPGLPVALRHTLDGYRRRWRWVTTLKGALLCVGIVIGAVGVAVAADRLWRLADSWRAILLWSIAAAAAYYLARRVIWPAVRRLGDRHAALRLGRRFPDMQEDLVSAVELTSPDNHQGVSRSLVANAIQQITRRTAGADPRAAVAIRPLVQAGVVCVAVALSLCAAYLLRPEAVGNALARLLRPHSAIPFFSYTKLRVHPGDHVVRTGDAVDLCAQTWGVPAARVRLDAHTDDETLGLTLPCTDGRARWRSGPLFGDLAYRMRAGDAQSDWYRVRVVPPPALERVSAVLRDPAYAGARPHTIDRVEGALEIVAGTAVQVRARPVARGDEPAFRCRGQITIANRRVALEPDRAGVLCSAFFTPVTSGAHRISLTDGFGLTNRSPEGVHITVVPDRRPQVRIVRPARHLVALPGDRIRVEAHAEDELGLRDLALCTRTVPGRSPQTRPRRWNRRVLHTGGVQVRTLDGALELDIAALGLEPKDQLEYRAEASDYADLAVLRRRYSEVYRITVVSEMEHLRLMLGKLKQIQLALLRRAAEQKRQAKQADALGTKADKGSVSDAARREHERERQYARQTEAVARRIERVLPELARNPSAPTKLTSSLERLARGVRSVATKPMGAAIKKFGSAAQAPEGKQGAPLRQAAVSCRNAARQLEQLADLAERLRRRSLLDKLASDAEALAARQREQKQATLATATETIGQGRQDLDKRLRAAVDRLVAAQRSIKKDTDALGRDIESAAEALSFTRPADAACARKAGEKLEADKTSHQAEQLARQIVRNVLFASLPKQQAVVQSLLDVAAILRRDAGLEDVEAIAKEIDAFIRRQTEINTDISTAIAKRLGGAGIAKHLGQNVQAALAARLKTLEPGVLGTRQRHLGQDVSEQASALDWLAKEIAAFRSGTAGKLDAAAREMKAGATDLHAVELQKGLNHGRKALALLKEARKTFEGELESLAGACQGCESLEALLLLMRILVGQKKVNRGTTLADRLLRDEPGALTRRTTRLAKDQSRLRVDARRLERMLRRFRGAGAVVRKAGGKMDASRQALQKGDTGKKTRVVQRQIVALLEKLLGECCGGCRGLAGARMMALMQMMGRAGQAGGGFMGGTNAPLVPATLDRTGDQAWRRVHTRFDERLGAAFEGTYPLEYRGLLTGYFDRLRKETGR